MIHLKVVSLKCISLLVASGFAVVVAILLAGDINMVERTSVQYCVGTK